MIKKSIKDKLLHIANTIIPSFYEEADKDASYPYAVFEFRKLREEDQIQYYTLEFNVWDHHNTYSRVDAYAEMLENALKYENLKTDECLIRIFDGTNENIEDPDKDIKRTRCVYSLNVFRR